MSTSLYTMTGEWQRIFDMLEDPDVPEEAIFDTIEMIEADMDIKAESYGKMIRCFEGSISDIDAEIKRLQERKTAMNNRIKSMKTRLMESMIATGRRKIKTPLFSFNIQKNGGKPPLLITGDVPNEWRKPGDPDNAAIRRELDLGVHLPFAELGEVGESLRIR